jgi:putative phosphoesterase
MKIVIVSDIHANLAAIEAMPEESYDQIWCLGDLVDYGPRPHETIRWVKTHAKVTVRGNHDHAAGFAVTPECSLPYRGLAATTRRYTQEVCIESDFEFLRELPLRLEMIVNKTRFQLVHAAPTDPLFGYLPADSEHWLSEVQRVNTDFLIVGHTHTPFVRQIDDCTIVNPGSIGQPKTGRPLACYAVWEDGRIDLKEYEYPIERTIADIRLMPIPERDQQALISILLTGQLAAPRSEKEILSAR